MKYTFYISFAVLGAIAGKMYGFGGIGLVFLAIILTYYYTKKYG